MLQHQVLLWSNKEQRKNKRSPLLRRMCFAISLHGDNSKSSCHCLSFRPYCRKAIFCLKSTLFFLKFVSGQFSGLLELYNCIQVRRTPNRAIYLIPPSSKHSAETAYPTEKAQKENSGATHSDIYPFCKFALNIVSK